MKPGAGPSGRGDKGHLWTLALTALLDAHSTHATSESTTDPSFSLAPLQGTAGQGLTPAGIGGP